MKTITQLEKHLHDYRGKKVDLPTYNDLIELTEAAKDILGAVANYVAKTKERENKLIRAAFESGQESANTYLLGPRNIERIYRVADVEELE